VELSNMTAGDDLNAVGYDVEARDGSAGKVDQATQEIGSGHVVVDTGPWVFGKKVLLPPDAVERVDADHRRVYVALTKDQIKDSPEYTPSPPTPGA
jgi:hypothetical protein